MHDEITPVVPGPVDDHEGAMASSELYRAAKYSMKLFQMIQDGQELEGWVQAKITKSADYLDSVYHYMEYQTKFGDGSHASNIDDITGDADQELPSDEPVSDMDDEERKIDEMTTYEQKLASLLEGAVKEASGVRASDKKKGKVDKSERKQYFVKLEKDNKTRGMTIVADEGEREGELRDRVKRDNIGWTVASIRVKDEIDEAAEKIAKAEKTAKNKKEKDQMIKEALTQAVEKAVGKAQKKFMTKADATKKADAMKKAGEKKKTNETNMMSPPDGATAAPKKDPKTGKYPKVTSGPNKGKEWSDKTPGPTTPGFKESNSVSSIVKRVVAEKKAGGKKPDANKDGIPDYAQDGKGPKDLGKGKDTADKGSDKPADKKGMSDKQAKFFGKKESVNESADLARMKQFLTRLNG